MRSIELDIYFTDGEAYQLEKLGVAISLEMNSLRKVTFYQISSISPYFIEGKSLCCIASNGMEYISSLTYEKVKERINNEFI